MLGPDGLSIKPSTKSDLLVVRPGITGPLLSGSADFEPNLQSR